MYIFCYLMQPYDLLWLFNPPQPQHLYIYTFTPTGPDDIQLESHHSDPSQVPQPTLGIHGSRGTWLLRPSLRPLRMISSSASPSSSSFEHFFLLKMGFFRRAGWAEGSPTIWNFLIKNFLSLVFRRDLCQWRGRQWRQGGGKRSWRLWSRLWSSRTGICRLKKTQRWPD